MRSIKLWVLGAWIGWLGALPGSGAALQWVGVNLAGAEFGQATLPGVHGQHYLYPNQAEVDYFRRKGMNCVRLCFRWERLQRSIEAALDPAEFDRFDAFVERTTAKGVHVILDPHNFARYHPQPPADYQGATVGLLGNDVPYSALSDLWSRLAEVYRRNDRVIFGLMNEPANMPTEHWVAAANAAIVAIRAQGATNLILVPGNGWSGAHSWSQDWYGTPNSAAMLDIVDPADRYAFEVHQYLDSDSSGTSAEIMRATIGRERLAGFTQWLRTHQRRGFLGEFAVANSTIDEGLGAEALDHMLGHLADNADVWLGWTWWAAGPWWHEYRFTLEPPDLGSPSPTDRPAMVGLASHIPVPVPVLKLVAPDRIEFEARAGFVFQAEVSQTLTPAGWTDQGPAMVGDGQPVHVSIPAVSGSDQFCRVRVMRAP